MIAPAAMMIETAIDELKSPTLIGDWVLAAQQKELLSAVPTAADDFRAGYELGLQTARVVLAGMPAAVFNKVSI